jgi:cytidylate kinase
MNAPSHRPMAAAPVVVIAGPTAAGKTTLARDLETGRRLTRALVSAFPDDTDSMRAGRESERLVSWLRPGPASTVNSTDVVGERLSDLATLAACDGTGTGTVVDTDGPAALLLPPRNAALLVLVDAAATVRAERVRRLLAADLTPADALQIVTRKDTATLAAVRAAWGLDIADVAATTWRFDLVIRCPDEESCRSAQRCTEASRAAVRAAVSVYRRFLRNETEADEVGRLATVAQRHRAWLVRIAPMLLDPGDGRNTLSRWRDRLRNELTAGSPELVGRRSGQSEREVSCDRGEA